jgi:hypothetical protein
MAVPDGAAAALKSTFATNRAWSDWAALAVVVGLVGDIVVIFLFSKDKPRSETWLAFICTLVIALGVYGEYAFGRKAAEAAGQLQEIADKQVADLNIEAGNARKESGKAIERASKADERAAGNEKDAAQLRERAGRLEVDAANLRRDNLELEAGLLPRVFKEQQGAIQRLRQYAGTHVVLEYLTDLECKRTAEQIAFVLHEAQWIYSPKPNADPDPMYMDGVTVAGDGIGRAVSAVVEELTNTGIETHSGPAGLFAIPEGTAIVRVGMKPNPVPKEDRPMMEALSAIEKAVGEGRMQDLTRLQDAVNQLKPGKPGLHITGTRTPLPNR